MQNEKPVIVSVKKVISIINSCETKKQLDASKRLIENYVKMAELKGVVNPDTIRKRLMKEYKQKVFQINMIKSFVRRDRKEFDRVPVKAIA